MKKEERTFLLGVCGAEFESHGVRQIWLILRDGHVPTTSRWSSNSG